MAFRDLRTFLDEVEKMGELKTLAGTHWDLEIGRITDIVCHRENSPAVLFDEIVGYPKGYRILINPMGSRKRLAPCLGLPCLEGNMEFVDAWRRKLKELKLIPPRVVKDGPILENVLEGNAIDLWKFPTPKWHSLDGGRYIGTGSVTITRDPEEGWVNLGTYRVMVHDRAIVGFYISPGKHGRIHREKYLARGETCKVAVSCGQDPHIFLASTMELPYGLEEYQFAGALRGKPIEVIESNYSGLPIPAHAEIVIEGEADFDARIEEGPFGEWTGYYGSASRMEPIIRVKRLYYRNDPIILGSPPGKPPWETSRVTGLNRSALIWDELERAGVPDVKGVWCDPAGGGRLFVVVAIKQRYPGHARQAGLVTTGGRAGGYCGRYVIVVDEDIDPSNIQDVIWAMGSRSDPAGDIEIIRRCWSTPLDPLVRKGAPTLNTRAIIDATRPYEWKEEFPPVVAFQPEELDETMEKWGKLIYD